EADGAAKPQIGQIESRRHRRAALCSQARRERLHRSALQFSTLGGLATDAVTGFELRSSLVWCLRSSFKKSKLKRSQKSPLNPPFFKGGIYEFNPSLEKKGRGDFWTERGETRPYFSDIDLVSALS